MLFFYDETIRLEDPVLLTARDHVLDMDTNAPK